MRERHYYVFTFRPNYDIPVYERTFPRMKWAWDWLRTRKHMGFVTANCLPEAYFY